MLETKVLNIMTVAKMSAHDMQLQIYPLIHVPVVSPNQPADLEGELAPLLARIANEASFLSNLQAVCVTSKLDFEQEGSTRYTSGGMREIKAKIDILDRAIKQSNNNWQAVSRIITIMIEHPRSRLRKMPGQRFNDDNPESL